MVTKATVDGPGKPRGRNWTDMEVNLFAAILVDEKYNFAISLENLAAKKSSNKEVLAHIKNVFDQALNEAEFKGNVLNKYFPTDDGHDNFEPLDTSPEKLRKKYNNLKAEWRKRCEQAKRVGRICLDREPRWFSLLNSVFTAAAETTSTAFHPMTLLYSADHNRRFPKENKYSPSPVRKVEEEEEPVTVEVIEYHGNYRIRESNDKLISIDSESFSPRTSAPEHHHPRIDEVKESETRSFSATGTCKKRNKLIPRAESSHRKRKLNHTYLGFNDLACGVQDLAASLLEIKKMSMENELKRDQMFLNFFAQEAEKNRAHEMRLAEIYSVRSPSGTSTLLPTMSTHFNAIPKPRRRSMLLNRKECILAANGEPALSHSNESPNIDSYYPNPQDED